MTRTLFPITKNKGRQWDKQLRDLKTCLARPYPPYFGIELRKELNGKRWVHDLAKILVSGACPKRYFEFSNMGHTV